MSNFFAKLLSLVAVPILNWIYEKTVGWVVEYVRKKRIKDELAAKQKQIDEKAAAATVKTEAAKTPEEIKSAAENTINNY